MFARHATLEDVFLRLTSEEFLEDEEETVPEVEDYTPQFVTVTESADKITQKEETEE